MITDLIFVALALLTVVPAVWVVFSPNIVHAGFALLFTLLGAAGLYAYLGADFIAVTQVMVYVGGVLVLVLFTVMMTRVPQHGQAPPRAGPLRAGGGVRGGRLRPALQGDHRGGLGRRRPAPAQPTTAVIGTNLMTDYIFPFEYVSLVLLAAMIGAALLIREHRNGRPTTTATRLPRTGRCRRERRTAPFPDRQRGPVLAGPVRGDVAAQRRRHPDGRRADAQRLEHQPRGLQPLRANTGSTAR